MPRGRGRENDNLLGEKYRKKNGQCMTVVAVIAMLVALGAIVGIVIVGVRQVSSGRVLNDLKVTGTFDKSMLDDEIPPSWYVVGGDQGDSPSASKAVRRTVNGRAQIDWNHDTTVESILTAMEETHITISPQDSNSHNRGYRVYSQSDFAHRIIISGASNAYWDTEMKAKVIVFQPFKGSFVEFRIVSDDVVMITATRSVLLCTSDLSNCQPLPEDMGLPEFTIAVGSFYNPYTTNVFVGGLPSYPYTGGTPKGFSPMLFRRIAELGGFRVNIVAGDWDFVFGAGPGLTPGPELVTDYGGPNEGPAFKLYHKTGQLVQVDGWDGWWDTVARKNAGFTFTRPYSTGPEAVMITMADSNTTVLDEFWDASTTKIGYTTGVLQSPECIGLTTEMMTRFPAPVGGANSSTHWMPYTSMDLDIAMQDLRDGVITAYFWTQEESLPENLAIPAVGPASDRKKVPQLGDASPNFPGFLCFTPGVGQAVMSFPIAANADRIASFQCHFNLGLARMRANGELMEYDGLGTVFGASPKVREWGAPNSYPTFSCA